MTTATMWTLTLRRLPDNESSAEIIVENVTNLHRTASEAYLDTVFGVRVLRNDSDNQNVVAVVSVPPPDKSESVIPGTFSELAQRLSDNIVKAVLIAHLDEGELNTKVVDELTGREYYARALKADGLRARDELIKADTPEGLQQKLDSPHVKNPYLSGRRDRKYDLPGFDGDMPFRPRPSFDDDLSRLAGVFGGMFGGEAFADVRRAYQQAHQAEADQEERALMQALAGTEITFKVDEDGTFHFTGELVYNPPAEPQD